jgi:hypothetical protein
MEKGDITSLEDGVWLWGDYPDFSWEVELFGEVLRGDFELSEGDGAVVALDVNVVFGDEAFALGGAGGAVEGDVLLDEFSVEVNGEEAGFFEKGAVFVEAGGAEFDRHFLPLTGGLGGVDFGSVAFEAFGVLFVVPAVVNGSHVAVGDFGFAVAVEDLDLVSAHEVDAGVGAFWDEEFGLDGAVAELVEGLKIAGFFWSGSVGVNQGLVSVLDDEGVVFDFDGLGGLPSLCCVSGMVVSFRRGMRLMEIRRLFATRM